MRGQPTNPPFSPQPQEALAHTQQTGQARTHTSGRLLRKHMPVHALAQHTHTHTHTYPHAHADIHTSVTCAPHLCAVHDGLAAVQLVHVIQRRQPLRGEVVAAVDHPPGGVAWRAKANIVSKESTDFLRTVRWWLLRGANPGGNSPNEQRLGLHGHASI